MTTVIIILGIITIIIIGFIQVFKRNSRVSKKIDFASEYRNKLSDFTHGYFENYGRYGGSGNFDGELYVWLTMNVNKMQGNLGSMGVMEYLGPFQSYKISNYQIIINTLPKFRDGSVKDFDINSADDCLLRYIGHLEEYSIETLKNLRNPIIWFREGFGELFSIPIFILNWFGIISYGTLKLIRNSKIYKVLAGLIALVTLISGIVTILVGYQQAIQIITKFLGK